MSGYAPELNVISARSRDHCAMIIDFLIIGQGLAGSLLAWELLQRGSQVVVIDNGLENASRMAAGLINPITGLRFAKSAGTEVLLPAAKNCYIRLEDFFAQNFYHEKPMLRIFRSLEESKNCRKRLALAEYRMYLGGITEPGQRIGGLEMPFGCLEQSQTGYLLTRPLLSCLKKFFTDRDCYRYGHFEYSDIRIDPRLSWQDLYPKQIIFCEGYHAHQNPWFGRLPWQPVKGEILSLQHNADLPDKILNFGRWLIPLNPQQCRIGASFERDCTDTAITQQAHNALLKSLKALAPEIQTVLIEQLAGIRPCTHDRQPFIGRHPYYPGIAIFNGFGAKGSLQIPWYAQHFADALLKGSALLETCNIRRYEKSFTG